MNKLITNKYYGKDGIELEVLGLPRIDGGGSSIGVRRAERVAERMPMVDAICLTEGGGRGVCRGGVESGQRIVQGLRRRINGGKASGKPERAAPSPGCAGYSGGIAEEGAK